MGVPIPAAQAFDLKRRLEAIQRAKEAQSAPAKGPDVGRVNRNEACPCGSGKKYKRCHGAAEGEGD
ncbi:MAG: hypothetical protein FJ298_00905 [Planctomycetes bacterium]|nr:hypothetical protein [Planctomycetota bacterium]